MGRTRVTIRQKPLQLRLPRRPIKSSFERPPRKTQTGTTKVPCRGIESSDNSENEIERPKFFAPERPKFARKTNLPNGKVILTQSKDYPPQLFKEDEKNTCNPKLLLSTTTSSMTKTPSVDYLRPGRDTSSSESDSVLSLSVSEVSARRGRSRRCSVSTAESSRSATPEAESGLVKPNVPVQSATAKVPAKASAAAPAEKNHGLSLPLYKMGDYVCKVII